MKIPFMVLCVPTLFLGGCTEGETARNKDRSANRASAIATQQENVNAGNKGNITREAAIGISQSDALRNHKTLTQFHLVTCETPRLWAIIYDGGGPEYLISKRTGRILQVHDIPDGADGPQQVSKEQAVEAVKDDFRKLIKSYGDREENVDKFQAFVCELSKTWRILFEFKEEDIETAPNSSPPFYVVDKATGKILARQLTG